MQKSKDSPAKDPNGLAIGEMDSDVFNCPACARPLAEGTSRCPGCGTRLIMGVRVKRAGVILALGVTLGVLVGGLLTAATITVSLNGPVAGASAAPSTGVSPSVAPSFVAPPNLGAPAAAISALSGTAVVNGRISVDADTLVATLARADAKTIEMARALRSLAADAALGIDLAGRIQAWNGAASVRTGLDDFYRAMADTARDGLRASLSDAAAYRKAGAAMVTVLGSLGDIDSRSRALAGTIGLELPPVVLPSGAPPSN